MYRDTTESWAEDRPMAAEIWDGCGFVESTHWVGPGKKEMPEHFAMKRFPDLMEKGALVDFVCNQ